MGVARKCAVYFSMAAGADLVAGVGRRGGSEERQRQGQAPGSGPRHLLGPGLGRLVLGIELEHHGTLAVAIGFAFEPVVDGGQRDVRLHELRRSP